MTEGGNSMTNSAASSDTDAFVAEALRQSGYYFNFKHLTSSTAKSEKDWNRLEVPHVHVCFNLKGAGSVQIGATREQFTGECFWYATRDGEGVEITRMNGQEHRFGTLLLSKQFLSDSLLALFSSLTSVAQTYLKQDESDPVFGAVNPLSLAIRHWLDSVNKPQVPAGARSLWYRAKALEVSCELFFEPSKDELFCHRHQRIAETRTSRVKKILETRLEEPPSLRELGKIVGCSPYYLSRTFSKEAGMTIPQFLRQRRMEKAAELLRAGRLNVTEVALEVGYNSMSHFSQAFCQTMGCCPAMYPLEKRL